LMESVFENVMLIPPYFGGRSIHDTDAS